MDYKEKYIKYKLKYLELKNNMVGGNPSLIIHICGASGAGKTTLGNKLQEKYGNKIVVKDIDELRANFIKEHYGNKNWKIIDKDAYQNYIDNYIDKINKPLIFVGLNHMPWWHKNLYYNMHSTHNFFIQLDNPTIIKQKCTRYLTEELTNITKDKIAMNDMIHNSKKFISIITNNVKRECNAAEIIQYNNKWNKDYKKQGYKFMSRENIYKSVVKLLNNIFGKINENIIQKK